MPEEKTSSRTVQPWRTDAGSPLGQLTHELHKLMVEVEPKNKRIDEIKKRIKTLTGEALGSEVDVELVVEGLDENLRIVEEARVVFDAAAAEEALPGFMSGFRKRTTVRKLIWTQR